MKHQDTISYTTEDLAELLQVSKLTIYDLIKKGEILAYRVGRQMRVDAADLEAYKKRMKSGVPAPSSDPEPKAPNAESQQVIVSADLPSPVQRPAQSIIISGQDMVLDLLGNAISSRADHFRILRAHTGSLNGLLSLVQGESDLVSTHLFDGDTGSYNLPYIRRILTGHEYTVVHLLTRSAGFYVQPGNPKNITSWRDLNRTDIRFINRELGSGIRVLTDERLRLEGILPRTVTGYQSIEKTHLAAASRVAAKEADVAVGIEKSASLVNVDFVSIVQEQYDLVMLKKADNQEFRETVLSVLQSADFKKELSTINGYNFSQTGQIMFTTP